MWTTSLLYSFCFALVVILPGVILRQRQAAAQIERGRVYYWSLVTGSLLWIVWVVWVRWEQIFNFFQHKSLGLSNLSSKFSLEIWCDNIQLENCTLQDVKASTQYLDYLVMYYEGLVSSLLVVVPPAIVCLWFFDWLSNKQRKVV